MFSCKYYVNFGDFCGYVIVLYREFFVRFVVFCEDLWVVVDVMIDKLVDLNINVNECKVCGGFFCLLCEN